MVAAISIDRQLMKGIVVIEVIEPTASNRCALTGDLSLVLSARHIVILNTLTALRLNPETLPPIMLSFILHDPGIILQQDNAHLHPPHHSATCLFTSAAFTWLTL
ncbi:hypothetical protein TNCV_2349281 [Trichonephila clavipes]|uniref:Uncharacterized protein n=1 Tax=Trichonephila clavipes TaxID=2585209 RepID=A0A8X6VPJ6_TRICX|nr:hypothetical protein TNCV_2349281 [Trichonephila clavipes]